jgi:hypothetical protein
MRIGSALGLTVFTIAACGGGEPPPKPPVRPPARTDPPALRAVADACARASACATRFTDPGACVEAWIESETAKEPDPLYRCLIAAKTCGDVSTCLMGGGDSRAASFCKQRPGVVSGCDGERLVSCEDEDSQESSVVDCSTLGASCREVKAAGGLVLRACVAPQKCPAGAPETRCDGEDAVVTCRDGTIERTRCKPGTRCQEHKDENGEQAASCQLPGGRRCTALGGRRCEGDRVVSCVGPGRVQVSDCAGLGLVCSGTGPRAGCYVPNDVECDREMFPRCERGTLVFCAAGRTMRVACDSVGMSRCAARGRGARAICAPPQGED